MSYYTEENFLTAVLRGDVPGYSVMNGMGEFESGIVDVDGADVCRAAEVGGGARLPEPADAGEQMTVISTSLEDGPGNNGILTLRIEYLDADGLFQTEDIVMNGTTAVDTVATDIRFVQDMYALTVGPVGVAQGDITVIKKGGAAATDLYQFIVAGGNKSLVPHRMVPVGCHLVLKSWSATEGNNKRAAFRLRSTDMNGLLLPGVFCFKDTTYLDGSTSGDMSIGVIVPALSIVKASYWSIIVGSEGSVRWWGYLIEDGY